MILKLPVIAFQKYAFCLIHLTRFSKINHRFNLLLISLFCSILFLNCNIINTKAANTVDTKVSGFATVNGSDLTLNNEKLQLKGHNFYPYQTPWSYMWSQWNGPEVQNEVAQASLLGDNVLRILVPYGDSYGWNDAKTGQVKPAYLNELRQMVQIAASFNMKVILTLFDFYGDFPADGTPEAAANITYLNTIVSTFANDDRVLAWDLHNEPDNYTVWKNNGSEKVLDWLNRMRQALKQLDSNHLVTVGAGAYENLWQTDSQGRSMISLSDFIGWHSYNALDFGNEVVHIREHSSKPILLEETGWPTGPSHGNSDFTDDKQVQVYKLALQTAQNLNLVGLLGWKLRDEVPVGLINLEDYQNYYGLLRHNATLKPAGLLFKDGFKVPSLPSTNQTSLPLTTQPVDEAPRAVYFPQTDHYVSTPLKELWRRAGGEPIFGLPLTDAIVEQIGDDGTPFGHNARIVQYFERASFEYYPDKIHEPDFLKYSHLDKYFYIVKFGSLGKDLAPSAVKNTPRVERKQPDSSNYQYFPDTGHDISDSYLAFWQKHYGDQILGSPISQPMNITDPDGKTLEVQYFERGRLEHHSELAGQTGEIQVSKLGIEALQAKGWLNSQYQDLPNNSFSDPAFFGVWRKVDGLVSNGTIQRSWLWGPNGFASVIEPYVEANTKGQRLVEYFDKSRMEITNSSTGNGASSTASFVTNGLLAKELISGQIQTGDNSFVKQEPAQIAIAGDSTEINTGSPTYASFASVTTLSPGQNNAVAQVGTAITAKLDKSGKVGSLPADDNLTKLAHNAAFITQTQHNIPDVFWNYLTNSKGLLLADTTSNTTVLGDVVNWVFSVGLPISEPYWIRSKVAGVERDVMVQAFERRILTYTPTNPAAFQVEMGNVGRHYFSWRYTSGNYYTQIGQ